MSEPRRPSRPRTLSGDVVDSVQALDAGTPDSELLDRLETALAGLPEPERAAVITAIGYAEGSSAVAAQLGLGDTEAEALSRNALQLLRGALRDLEPGTRERYARMAASRRRPGREDVS